MIKKLHFRLTIFFTIVIGIVLTVMTIVLLLVSESGMRKNYYMSFLNDITAMYTYLENQSLISNEWLSKMENGGLYMIHIEDNGQPLFFSTLVASESREAIIEQAKEISTSKYGFDISLPTRSTYLTTHREFQMTADDKISYYISTAVLPKNNGHLSVVIASSKAPLEQQIVRQRLLFIAIDIISLAILSVFSFIFTRRMLRPIEENRQRQVQFVASASHELRSPLAVILSCVGAVKKSSHDKAKQEKFIDSIQSESLRMSRLVDDMLALAGADNKTWSLNNTLVEMDTLLIDVYEKFESLSKKKNITLELLLTEDYIPLCKCDHDRIEQVLTILMDNALSYSYPGGHVLLSLTSQMNYMTVKVQDNGPGILAEDKTQIFERFYRIDQSHTEKKHVGLGLCIAKEIIKLHKGKIWAEDSSGGGSTFIFTLPL